MNIFSELQNIKSTRAELKKFGLSVGGGLLTISIFIFLTKDRLPTTLLLISIFLIISGHFLPAILKPIQKLWMGLALILGFISTRVILTLLFIIAVIPTGLIAKLFNYDPLQLKKKQKSYWKKVSNASSNPKYYEKQF